MNRDHLRNISIRLNLTSSLVLSMFVLALLLSVRAAPQESSPASSQSASQPTASKPDTSKLDAPHRTEPEEPEVTDREKRELEIRAKQTIGKVIVSPDGSFFLYEWRRPYDWDKDFGILPSNVPAHMQSWIYRVDPDISATDSKYLFLYESGASQWLGSLSPDANRVSFYSLDDDNKLKTGVWDFAKSKIIWFETIAPDPKRLDQAPVWTSKNELIYPAAAGKLVRASLVTGRAALCADCKNAFTQGEAANRAITPRKAASDRGPDVALLARSRNGKLNVYARSTSNLLALEFKAGEEKVETVFEGSRLGSGPPPLSEGKN